MSEEVKRNRGKAWWKTRNSVGCLMVLSFHVRVRLSVKMEKKGLEKGDGEETKEEPNIGGREKGKKEKKLVIVQWLKKKHNWNTFVRKKSEFFSLYLFLVKAS